jgi:hypothetical protein
MLLPAIPLFVKVLLFCPNSKVEKQKPTNILPIYRKV